MTFRTRFAPSPTGPLHLGHAYSAWLAHDQARAAKGAFLLRIDDIDQSRARAHWEDQLKNDLTWLGLDWDGPIRRQSDHFADYRDVLEQLAAQGLLYPCSCKRRDIEAAANAPQEGAPEFGPDGRIYPGTCRDRPMSSRLETDALRLDLSRLHFPHSLSFEETGPLHAGRHGVTHAMLQREVGDPVLARPNMAASYHLSVVIDDADQAITHVTRGADLFDATFLHVALQTILGLPTPVYHHHDLIRDENGKRLAKRDDARAISKYRSDGLTPDQIRKMLGL
ncbi:MAG: tRNA glutamyl-Q(34) synthetase GluQRS [Arenibacterium sp.]